MGQNEPMPTPKIVVTINEPRLELKKEGWSKSRVAASIRAALISKVPGPDESCLDRFRPADFPNGVWQDPDTGIILMRPSALRPDYAESSDFFSARIKLSDLTVPAPVGGVALFDEPSDPDTGKPKLIALQRDDPDVDIAGLTGLSTWVNAVHPASNDSSMVFVAAFAGPMSINEGFTLTIQPSGIATDRASAWFGVMFGDRYYLQLGMNGAASLWEYRYSTCATGASTDWVRRERFEYAQGGVDHTKPFQMTIMPWGMEFISILFSQAAQPSKKAKATDLRTSSNTFTFKVTLSVDDLPRIDGTHNHYVKLEPAPIRIAMRKKGFQYAFALARIRFAASTSFYGLPEQLTEVKGVDVTTSAIGFRPTGTTMTCTKVNEDGATWDIDEHIRFAPLVTLNSDTSRKYTPELWGLEYDCLATTHTPDVDAFDVSTLWTSLTWRMSCHPDSNELSMVMRRDTDWLNLIKLDGCITIKIDSVEYFQGYIEQYRPHFDGLPITVGFQRRAALGLPNNTAPGVPLRDNPVADDHWQRLADTDGANFKSLTGTSLGAIFETGFKRAGYDFATECEIDAEVYTLEVDGFTRANDWKQPQEDANIADLFRRLITSYGTQNAGNLRCIRLRGKWRVYIARAFDILTDTPDLVFMLDDKAIYSSPVTDDERWDDVDGPRLRVQMQPEIYIKRPEFNDLRCLTTDEPGENAVALAAFIAPHPDTIDDPTFIRYEGRVRSKTMGPSECGHLSTQNELERFARRLYDETYREVIQWTHGAEWVPGVEPDQFAWIVGLGPAGTPVSYGVYRIEEIEVNIEHDNVPDVTPDEGDFPQTLGDRRFTWKGEYTLVWESAYEVDGIPMWSTVHPE
jgi:hypothetical protein